jgi:hypothetical protein
VAQASSQLQQLTHWFQNTSLHVTDSREFRKFHLFVTRTLRLSPEKLWSGVIVAALLVWNWHLVLALVIGAVVLVAVYLAQQGQWKIPQINGWRLWQGANRSLTVAIASGSIAALSAYVTAGIWCGTEQGWLAIGIILQGFGTLTVLGLLTWQTLNRQVEASEINSDSAFKLALADLADADPLKRLIAVRQIIHWMERGEMASPMTSAHLADCFRLMLNRETESSVCSALLDGLQALGQGRQLNPGTRQTVPSLTKTHQVEQ